MAISRETSRAGRKPALTTANVDQRCKSVLADPGLASQLRENWRKFLLSMFETTSQQAESLSLVPPARVAMRSTCSG